jgi:glycosyltransferase involved in cell wall biosynthesis
MSPQISFIVIGRNQSATICASLESVERAARAAASTSHEVIYVDSDSTDGSVDAVAGRFGESVRIVRLTGARNAGIGRNVGASLASGSALFFIDGDMEVDPEFLLEALDSRHRLVHPIVTGQLPEKLYDPSGKLLGDAPDRYKVSTREFRAELGGVFVVDRELFEAAGGFCPELRCNEDLDLGLRLARSGTRVLALARPIALHHTVDYFEWARLVRMTRDGSLFFPAVLIRRHLTNRHYLPIMLVHQRSPITLLLSVTLGLFAHPAGYLLFPAFLAARLLKRREGTIAREVCGTALRGFCVLLGLVAFFPSRIPADRITYLDESAGLASRGGARYSMAD